jgi:hypothetical protein
MSEEEASKRLGCVQKIHLLIPKENFISILARRSGLSFQLNGTLSLLDNVQLNV